MIKAQPGISVSVSPIILQCRRPVLAHLRRAGYRAAGQLSGVLPPRNPFLKFGSSGVALRAGLP